MSVIQTKRRAVRAVVYTGVIAVTIVIGLKSRSSSTDSSTLFGQYGGDILWAFMIYWGAALLFFKQTVKLPTAVSFVFSYAIEFSQFCKWEKLMELRATRFGALILGHGFLFSDLICYSIGIAAAVLIDYFIVRRIINVRFISSDIDN